MVINWEIEGVTPLLYIPRYLLYSPIGLELKLSKRGPGSRCLSNKVEPRSPPLWWVLQGLFALLLGPAL